LRPVGPGTGDGVIHITNGTLSQRVTFTNLEPVIDTVTGDSLTIAGTESDNTFTFTQGLDASRGKVAVDAFETIEFGNKGTLKLGGAGGNDSFDIQHTSAAAGLAGIEIAGTAQGNDSVTIQTNSQDVNVSSGRIDIGAQTLVTHTNVNSVGLGAVDALTVSGDDNANTLVLTPTSTDAAGFAQDNGPAFTVQSLQSFSYEGRAGNDQATLSGSTQLSPTNGVSLDGGDGTDTLSGHPIDTAWTINQANRGTANAISFAGFENLIGSTANDNFQVADGGSIESITGGAGENQLGYSARTAPVTVDLATLSSSGVNSFAAIDAIVGTEFSDTLIGPDQVNSWNILQNNAGDINGVTTFSGFENLTGNQQSDNFRFLDGASISGTLSGGAGSDTLDASAHTAPVNINLQSLTSSTAGSIASVEDLRAGTAGGTLERPVRWHG
jgi:hypothetical protein